MRRIKIDIPSKWTLSFELVFESYKFDIWVCKLNNWLFILRTRTFIGRLGLAVTPLFVRVCFRPASMWSQWAGNCWVPRQDWVLNHYWKGVGFWIIIGKGLGSESLFKSVQTKSISNRSGCGFKVLVETNGVAMACILFRASKSLIFAEIRCWHRSSKVFFVWFAFRWEVSVYIINFNLDRSAKVFSSGCCRSCVCRCGQLASELSGSVKFDRSSI